MNIKALLTTLAILGSSSVAMARPVTYSTSAGASFSFGGNGGPVVRDHRYPRRMPVVIAHRERSRWQNSYDARYQPRARLLADGLSFGYTQYRKDIVVGSQKGLFHSLRLASDGGRTYIMKVVIEFAGGGVQRIDLNRTLRGNQAMLLKLDGYRAIHRILVYRADGDEALNMRARHYGGFSVSAL